METPNSELLDAYKRTEFVVDYPCVDGKTTIRHGESNNLIDKLLLEHNVTTGTFITAHNPHSRRLSDGENHKRHRTLLADVERQGFAYLTGRGIGTDDWPAEESLFVLGTSHEQATSLGREHGQFAIVWVEIGRVAEIALC
jgi:hypothetical protein